MRGISNHLTESRYRGNSLCFRAFGRPMGIRWFGWDASGTGNTGDETRYGAADN